MFLSLPILAGFCIGLFFKLSHTENDQRIRKLNTKHAHAKAQEKLNQLKQLNSSNKSQILSSLLTIMESYLYQRFSMEEHIWNKQLEEIKTKKLLTNDTIENLKEYKRSIEIASYNPSTHNFSAEENIQYCEQLIQEIEAEHGQRT
jgi:hypothetical protein